MLTAAAELQERLAALGDPRVAEGSRRFFKTGPGGYGEGDLFRGVRVPALRALAKEFQTLPPREAERLLGSPFHEDRLLALLILVSLYSRGDETSKEEIYRLYLKNTRRINNWDLVDSSAEHIVGAHLRDRPRAPLRRLAKSEDLWERRIAVLATLHFIKRGESRETFEIARALLSDREDLIHKAVGWMLREVGKRDPAAAEEFLKENYGRMPRTMLRYAVERFPEGKRRAFLKGEV